MSERSAERQTKSIDYIVQLRAISCIAVVVLHTALAAAGSFEMTLKEQIWTMLLRNMMLWAVPCFIMVTGALLLDQRKEISYRKLFCKYIKRIVLCILIFTAVFELFDLWLNGQKLGLWVITEYLYKVIAGKSWSHMWYLYMLIGLYLLLPFYKMIALRIKRADMIYLMIIYFVFLSVLPLCRDLFEVDIAFFICVSAIYPFFLFAGHFLHSGMLKISNCLIIVLLILSVIGLGCTTAAAYILQSAVLKRLLGSYSFPFTVIQAVCIFALFEGAREKIKKRRIWADIDQASFGIYLVHMIFLKLIYVKMKFNPFRHGGVMMLFFVAAIVFCLSYAAVMTFYFLRKR